MRLLKEKENLQNQSLYHPENYTTNARLDYENWSQLSANGRQRAIDLDSPMRARSAKFLLKKGMNYKFKL